MQNYYSAQKRRQLVSKYRASGLSQSQFAEQQGLKLSTLRQWIYRLGPPRRRLVHPPPAFQEVPLAGVLFPENWAAELRWAGGMVLRLHAQADVEWVGALVERLS
jgi:hypothetical protein